MIARSLQTGDNTFLMSDTCGRIMGNWVRSAMIEEPLGPEILSLKIPVYMFHGTADVNALVQPVYALRDEAEKLGKSNIHFTFFLMVSPMR